MHKDTGLAALLRGGLFSATALSLGVLICSLMAGCSSPSLTSGGDPSIAEAEAESPSGPPPTSVLHPRLDSSGERGTLSFYLNESIQRGVVVIEHDERQWTSPVYPLWAAAHGDVDGDGQDEILLGIWSSRPRHDEPQPHRTVWVMGWSSEGLKPRWRGSSLARPLVDFAIADLDRDDVSELLSVERDDTGCHLTAYRWTGFGFGVAAKSTSPCDELSLCGRHEACALLSGRSHGVSLGEGGLTLSRRE